MNKKNLNVNLKEILYKFPDLKEIYIKFKKQLLIFKKKSYVIAVSGGPDSLALVALSIVFNQEKKTNFHYVLVNHNIRKNSYNEALQVKNLLKKNKIKLHICSNKKRIERNIQGKARNIRYELLSKYCLEKKINAILTAHNLEDQVETFFIRLSRGSGLTGLSAMKVESKLTRNILLLRPLLNTKKNLLIKITKNVFGKYFKDPTNNNTKYLRTKIRSLKKSLSKSGIHYDQILKSINNLASSQATLDGYFKETCKQTLVKKKGLSVINLKKFDTLNSEVKMQLINISIKNLKNNYYNLRSKKVLNLIENIKKKGFVKSTLGGCLFIKKGDKLSIKIEKN